MALSSFRGSRSESSDVQLHIGESVTNRLWLLGSELSCDFSTGTLKQFHRPFGAPLLEGDRRNTARGIVEFDRQRTEPGLVRGMTKHRDRKHREIAPTRQQVSRI